MYRYVDALVVRAAACRLDCQPAWWPDVTEQATCQVSWRPWLRQVLAMPEFAVALEQASPVLADRARAICDGSPVADRAARRVVLSVMRYLLRAGGRATPYGLFAGVAPAGVAATGVAQLGGTPRMVARVRAEWLVRVVERLEADPCLQPHLMVRSNNLLVDRGGYVVLEHRASRTRGGAPTHLWVRATGPVRAALAFARDPIRWGDLAEKLATEFSPGVGRVDALLAQMVAQRLLVTRLRPPMTATDPLAHVVAELATVVGDAAAAGGLVDAEQFLAVLRQIIDRATRHDSSSTMAAAREQRRELAASLAAVCPTDEPAVAVDLRLDGTLAVPPAVAAEAARAAGVLVRLGRPAASGWAVWHGRFLERFGPHAVVPVLQAVDPDTGLGYPPGFQGALPGPAPALTDRDRKLLALAQRAALARVRELVLDENTLADLAGAHLPLPIQPTTELTVRVHAPSMNAVQRGGFQLSIVAVSRHAGTTTGRFLDLFAPSDRKRIATQYGGLPTATRGALQVQISAAAPYTIIEDVARAPRILPDVLTVGEYHDNPREGQLLLDDLAVTADEHRVYLVSVSRRRVVEPVVFNAVEPTRQTLPLVRFLAEAPTALGTPCTAFDWGAAASLPFLPALRHGRTILSPARWLLSKAELPDPTASAQRWSQSLAAWRDAVACPETVYLGNGDQRISLDLAEPAHQALLRDHLTRRNTALLRADPAPDAAGWIAGTAHELVIPLATTVEPAPPPRLPTNLHVVQVREHGRLPGGEGRCYVKLYGHPDRQTMILTHQLPALLDKLDPGVRWWSCATATPNRTCACG